MARIATATTTRIAESLRIVRGLTGFMSSKVMTRRHGLVAFHQNRDDTRSSILRTVVSEQLAGDSSSNLHNAIEPTQIIGDAHVCVWILRWHSVQEEVVFMVPALEFNRTLPIPIHRPFHLIILKSPARELANKPNN